MKKKDEFAGLEEAEKTRISRRKLLASLGAAGVALVASSALPLQTAKASGTLDILNVKDFGAAGDGVADDTDAFNAAIEQAEGGGIVFAPRGVYLIDPSPGRGIVLKTGINLIGEGDNATVLTAMPVGGSVIRRDFSLTGPNAYLQDVYVAHLAVVLNHPSIAAPGNYEQIGIDFRNITRSTVYECYAGNFSRGALGKPENPYPDMAQGYGIVFGNVSSGYPWYAGGEVNTAQRCTVWGAKKAIVLDDLKLSPLSSAHATVVQNCDVQLCELGIGSESIYTAGLVFENNIVQYLQRQRGSTAKTYLYRIEGYGNRIMNGYIESQRSYGTDYVVYLGPYSRRNQVNLGYYSSDSDITDLGTGNLIEYIDAVTNKLRRSFNKLPHIQARVKFDSAGTIVEANGVSGVVKNGTGSYRINWSEPFPTDHYSVSCTTQVDAAGKPGIVAVSSQTTGGVSIGTFKINNGGHNVEADFPAVIVTVSTF